MRNNDVRIGGFRVLAEIHGGGQGKIVKAVCEASPFEGIEPGAVVALKVMPVVHDEGGQRWARLQEWTGALAKLLHPNVVKCYGCFREKSAVCDYHVVVMDYLPGYPDCSLRDAIQRALKSESGHLPMIDVLQAFKCYAHGLQILHEKFGCQNQNNIRPSALYYNAVKPDGSAIMDFNWPQTDYATFPGTITHDWYIRIRSQLPYIAPEAVVTGCRGNASMDIYALGLSLYEALTGKTAYPPLPPGMDASYVLYERAKKHVSPTFDSPVVTECPALLSLLKDMTNIDSEKRIKDAAEVERRIGEIIKGGFSISDDPIMLGGNPPFDVLDDLDESNSALPLPSVSELARMLLDAEVRMKRWRVAAACFAVLLIAALTVIILKWIGRIV